MPQHTEAPEWLNIVGGGASHAAKRVRTPVFVGSPALAAQPARRHTPATVEQVAAASALYCPFDRKVVEVNRAIISDSRIFSADARGAGWFVSEKLARAADADAPRDKAADLALVG